MMKPGKSKRQSPIGEALLKDGAISEDQLKRALRVQSLLEEPRQLGDVLVELGYATKKAVQ